MKKINRLILTLTLTLALCLTACAKQPAEPEQPAPAPTEQQQPAEPEQQPEQQGALPEQLPIAKGDAFADAEAAAEAYLALAIQTAEEGMEYKFIDSKLTRVELLETIDGLTDQALDIYAIEYRLLADDPSQIVMAGGMSLDGDWLTQTSSMGSPLLVLEQSADGYVYRGFVWDGEVAENGGNLRKTVRRLLYLGQSERPLTAQLSLQMDGQSETYEATLFTDIGCSFYADADLTAFGGAAADEHSLTCIEYSDTPNVYLALIWLGKVGDPTLALGDAQVGEKRVVTLDDGSAATMYTAESTDGQLMKDIYVMQGKLGWYAFVCSYTPEMAEGWGLRLNAMARTFQFESWE